MSDSPNFPDPANITDPVIRAKVTYLLEKSLLDMETERWQARRRMAWVSLFGIMAFTGCLLFLIKPNALQSLTDVITWTYISLTAIVGGYLGTSILGYIAAVKGKIYPTTGPATTPVVQPNAMTPFDSLEKEIKKPT